MRKFALSAAALTASLLLLLSSCAPAAKDEAEEDAFVSTKTTFTLDLPTDRVIKVACVGDSITHGTDDRGFPSYPAYLNELLGDKYDVRNFGVSGASLMFSDNISAAYTLTDQYQPSLEFEPDVVIIMLGTNDSAAYAYKRFEQYFDSDYQALVDSYKNLSSHPYVIAATSPYVARPADDTAVRVNDVIVPHQLRLFEEMDSIDGVVDIWSYSKERYYLYNDGVHYTPMGYYTLAVEFLRHIFGIEETALNTVTVHAVPGAVVELDGGMRDGHEYIYNAVADETGAATCYAADGSYDVTVRAEDFRLYTAPVEVSGDTAVDCPMTAGDHNVALYRPITASTEQDEKNVAENLNDRDYNSRWSPVESNDECWVTVDLGDAKEIHGLRLEWDLAFGSGYRVEVSDDGESFTQAAVITGGQGTAVDEHFFDPARGRYVRVVFTDKGSALRWNYCLYDLQILSSDERTVSQRELDAAADSDATDNAADETSGSVLPWLIADGVIVAAGLAGILVPVLRKRNG